MSIYDTFDVYSHLPDLHEVQSRVAIQSNRNARKWNTPQYALPERETHRGYSNPTINQINPKVLMATTNAYRTRNERNEAVNSARSAVSNVLTGNYENAIYELSLAINIVTKLQQNAHSEQRDDQAVAKIYEDAFTNLI